MKTNWIFPSRPSPLPSHQPQARTGLCRTRSETHGAARGVFPVRPAFILPRPGGRRPRLHAHCVGEEAEAPRDDTVCPNSEGGAGLGAEYHLPQGKGHFLSLSKNHRGPPRRPVLLLESGSWGICTDRQLLPRVRWQTSLPSLTSHYCPGRRAPPTKQYMRPLSMAPPRSPLWLTDLSPTRGGLGAGARST